MAFTTENRKIRDIFQRASIYEVPRYQRDYVWKEINWKELWIDLQFTLKQNNKEIPWSHFLGTIVLNQRLNKTKGIDIYEIIDGQQRMMTVYLLLIVLYKNFNKLGTESSKKRGTYIYDTFITSLNMESERELVISNDLYDNEIKLAIDSASRITTISKDNKLYKLYSYFDNLLKNKNFDYLDKFLDKLLSVNIVEIISGEDEEIYNIFEVLNARGQKLKQIELLKNHIMKYVQPREREFIDNAKSKWRIIQENINHLNDPDALIQHFTKCYIEKDAENQNSIYRLIKEEIKIEDLSNFLNELEFFSKIYKEISQRDNNDSVIRYFNIKRNQQIRSLLCAIYGLYNKNIIDEQVKNQSLLQIRNFFFIFNTTQQTSNKTDKLISTISYKVYNCETQNEFKILFTDFMNTLYQYIENKDYKLFFETNQSFKYSNKDKNLKRNSRLVKYVLELIYSYTQNDTSIISNEVTLEHLKSDDGTLENSSIWNITLTNEEINSNILKNKPILEKIEILKDKSSIKENQNLSKYIDNDEFNIIKRKNELINTIFENVFKFDKSIFHLTKEDIERYKYFENIFIENDEKELLKLLKEEGKNFEVVLSKNPKYNELNNRFKNLDNIKFNDELI
ncbi:DUF262 domain-containing protein [Leptotrichia shahii]|uniref:DUF262 domain-containing protein n=1 Tax=Leptotrichia shahii TaxID=157691 RepID=UPI0028D279CC|nr:DUF262 domain-containing protein [Leptotrichia shahii]